jgi:hypothetical protein
MALVMGVFFAYACYASVVYALYCVLFHRIQFSIIESLESGKPRTYLWLPRCHYFADFATAQI